MAMGSRWTLCAIVLACVAAAVAVSGCQDKAGMCQKMAQDIRGSAKKQLPASAALPEPKFNPAEKEIGMALRIADQALNVEMDEWNARRPDKNAVSETGANNVKNFAEALRSLPSDTDLSSHLHAHVHEYASAVDELWKASKEKTGDGAAVKAAMVKVEAAQYGMVEYCVK
jgi:hypothetical protein